MSKAFLNTEIGLISHGDKIKVVVDDYKPKTVITVHLIIYGGGYYLNTHSFNNGVFPDVPKVNGYGALYKFSPGQRGIKFKSIIDTDYTPVHENGFRDDNLPYHKIVTTPLPDRGKTISPQLAAGSINAYAIPGTLQPLNTEAAPIIIPKRRIMKLNQNL